MYNKYIVFILTVVQVIKYQYVIYVVQVQFGSAA